MTLSGWSSIASQRSVSGKTVEIVARESEMVWKECKEEKEKRGREEDEVKVWGSEKTTRRLADDALRVWIRTHLVGDEKK